MVSEAIGGKKSSSMFSRPSAEGEELVVGRQTQADFPVNNKTRDHKPIISLKWWWAVAVLTRNQSFT